MAATTNPIMAFPGGGSNLNPTGLTSPKSPVVDPIPTANPTMPYPTGSPGNYGYGSSANPNPTMIANTPTGPGTSLTPGGTGATPGVPSTAPGSSLQQTLAGTFHTGYGGYLGTLLQSEGGINLPITEQTVQAQTAAMQHQIQEGAGALETNLGASGVSPNSSVAALELGDYMSQATAQENAITAEEYFNMWNSAMGREFGLASSLAGPVASEKASESFSSQFGAITGGIGNLIGNSGVSFML